MKILKIILIALFLTIPIITTYAKRKPCDIMVDTFKEPYKGKCSWFEINGKAAINPKADNYVAMRWDYKALAKHWDINDGKINSKVIEKLKTCWVLIKNPENGKKTWGRCADWGPAKWTGRHIDLDPDIMKKLKCSTDDVLIATLYENKQKIN